jgi:hypothetical protein
MVKGPSSNGFRDPLSPGAIALAELETMGLRHLVDEADVDSRGPLTCRQVSALDLPPLSTLPLLGRAGLILEGGTNLLYSYPKVGKTELLTAMCAEWADAGLRILYLTEESFGNWQRRLAVHNCKTIDNWSLYESAGCDLSHALELIRQETFDVLVVDTLRNAVGFIESDGDKDVARVLHPLMEARGAATLVCGYHARKMPGDGGRDISGHHSLYGVFDRALQMTPVEGREAQRKVVATGRCMYDGDMSLFYEMSEPGVIRALDGAAVVEKVKASKVTKPARYCPQCKEEFVPERSTAKFCGDDCRREFWRESVSQKVDGE